MSRPAGGTYLTSVVIAAADTVERWQVARS